MIAAGKKFLSAWFEDHPYAHHLLLETGLKPSNSGYTRFIILGRSRTGSNFLRGLLASRADVIVLGEILKNPENIEWGLNGFPQARNAAAVYREDPAAFLSDHVFRSLPTSVNALGFKLFYYHSRQDDRKSAWHHLKLDKSIRVIHIKRNNILHTFLSWTRANENGRWVARAKPDSESEPVTLTYEDCLHEFESTRKWEQEADEFFSDHSLLSINYEDLAADYQKTMVRIQKFLGIPYAQVKPQTYKQSRLPLDQAITNFHELKDRFQGSTWEEFFETAEVGRANE